MRDADRYEFKVESQLHTEAMIAASQTLTRGRNALVAGLIGGAMTALAAFGGAAIVAVACKMMGADPTWWTVGGLIAGGAFYLIHQGAVLQMMAETSAARPINQGIQVMTFDQSGVLYETRGLSWRTPWCMIDDVIETKGTVCLVTGGIALALPKATIEEQGPVDQLVSDLRAQIARA